MKYKLDPLSPTGVSPISLVGSTEVVSLGGSSVSSDLIHQLPPAYITNNYFDCGMGGSSRSTIAGAVGRCSVTAFVPNLDITVNLWALDVTTGVASALARAVIYDSDGVNSLPGTKLLESADFNCSSIALVSESISFTFVEGHLYWVGAHHSSTATLRAIGVADCKQIAVIGTAGGATYNGYRRDVAFGTDSPDPFGTPVLSNANMPQVKFRIA